MSDQGLSLEEVRHLARLARLRPDEASIPALREQLASILDHVSKLRELDLRDVEPMSHPNDATNRLDDDVVGPSMATSRLTMNAPEVEGEFLAVPKVLDDGEGA